MSYEDPRAYLLGLEGVALLRAFTGEHDRDFVEARIAPNSAFDLVTWQFQSAHQGNGPSASK